MPRRETGGKQNEFYNEWTDGIEIARQAMEVAFDATVGRLCTLTESTFSDVRQCEAFKKTLKDIVREEQTKVQKYLARKARWEKGMPAEDEYCRNAIEEVDYFINR